VTDQERVEREVEVGAWALAVYRLPRVQALAEFRKAGARCEHGELCENCMEATRTVVASMARGESEPRA
jgi:hypothetical protein